MLVWISTFSNNLIFIFNGKTKGINSVFMGWSVFYPQGNQWETFTKLNFDEDAEWPVRPQSPLQSVGAWAAPQNGPAPQHWFIIHHDHKLMDEEEIPMAATIPAPLASDKSASLKHDCPRKKEKQLHCPVQHTAACSSPLHRTLVFKAIHD